MLKLVKSVVKVDGSSDELFALAEVCKTMAKDAKALSKYKANAIPIQRAYAFLSTFLRLFAHCAYTEMINKEEEEKNV